MEGVVTFTMFPARISTSFLASHLAIVVLASSCNRMQSNGYPCDQLLITIPKN